MTNPTDGQESLFTLSSADVDRALKQVGIDAKLGGPLAFDNDFVTCKGGFSSVAGGGGELGFFKAANVDFNEILGSVKQPTLRHGGFACASASETNEQGTGVDASAVCDKDEDYFIRVDLSLDGVPPEKAAALAVAMITQAIDGK